MADILQNAKNKYGQGGYEWEMAGTGLIDEDEDGLKEIDCSHLVWNVLKYSGYAIPYFSTSELSAGKGKLYYDKISNNEDIRPGDIILFRGHEGIIETYDPETNSGTYFVSQTSTGPATTTFGPNDPYWKYRTFEVFRPKTSPLPCDPKNKVKSSRSSFTTAKATQPPPPPCPIVLDLDGDGVETTSINAAVFFDHNRDGFAEQTGWFGADDGLLVRDINVDGIINDGKELFGNNTLLQNGQAAANGFAALADLDGNADGKIDATDAAFSQLKVWQDVDGDGVSSSNELFTLDELGITAINTGYTSSTYIDPNGNEHRQVGSFTWADGTSGNATDIWFQSDPTYTIATEWLDVPADIAALPDLQGYGTVYDLQQAMVRDTSLQLKGLVESFVAATDPAIRNSLMEQILFKWTGVDGIAPGSRGSFIDARKLAALGKFLRRSLCWSRRFQPKRQCSTAAGAVVPGHVRDVLRPDNGPGADERLLRDDHVYLG